MNARQLIEAVVEGAEVNDLLDMVGHIEGPYSLGTAEDKGWVKAFNTLGPPRKVIVLFSSAPQGQDEVTRLVQAIFQGANIVHSFSLEGQERQYGLYQGIKFMLNPGDVSAAFDMADQAFVAHL